MLSNKEIICPEKLLKLAKTKGPVKVVIVNAGKAVSIESTKQAFDEGLIVPVFIGDKKIIEKLASDIKWDVSKFEITKSQKRVAKKNADLNRRTNSPWATEEQYDLFRAYLENRHADGGMADMDVFEFAAMIEETPIRTRVMEYEQHHDLKAVCLTDMLNDGLSMVYSFFDPDLSDRSMGTYLILDHIKMAQELGLPYVYLGYWVPGSPKMGYKARFSGLEIYRDKAWTPLSECENISSNLHPLNTAPIAEQVANLSLPGSNPLGE